MKIDKNFIGEDVGVSGTTDSYDFGKDLVGYRPLNGDANDIAGTNNGTPVGYVYADGTPAGNVTMGEDTVGKYVYCNGTKEAAAGASAEYNLGNPAHLNFQPANSFELVWKGETASFPPTQGCGLFGRYYSSAMRLASTGRIQFGLRSTTTTEVYTTPNNTVLANTVYTIGLSYDGSAKKLYAYIDGVLQNAGGLSITLTDFRNNNWYIGDNAQTAGDIYSQPTTHYFAGIFNRQLTDDERTLLVNKAKDDYSPISNGLVGWWSGRDYTGTEATPTGILDKNNLVQGNIAGSTAWRFDGVNDYITIPNIGNINIGTVSFNCYLIRSSNTGYNRLISSETSNSVGKEIYFRPSSGTIGLIWGAGVAEQGFTSNLTGWYNITISYDGTTVRYYLNGNKLSSSGTITNYGSTNLKLGVTQYTNASFSNCSIKNLSAWSRVLSDAEVLALIKKVNQYG